jgi:ATP-binding cassette, subfamily C (CFTR/MRP), member 1
VYVLPLLDTTPVGRIINRFSQDIAVIDEDLASSISQFVGMGGAVLGSVAAICASTKGTFLILIIPLARLYITFNAFFKRSNTAIARIEAVSRSPIYADFSQTLGGTTTIRSYNQQQSFINRLETYANNNTIPAVTQQLAMQWLSLRLDFIGAIVQFFMGCVAVAFKSYDFIPAGYLALGLSYAIQMTAMLKLIVRCVATMEAQFNSVERIQHYVNQNHSEDGKKRPAATDITPRDDTANIENGDIEMAIVDPALENSEIIPDASWPAAGVIEFQNIYMQYRDLDCVLKVTSIPTYVLVV